MKELGDLQNWAEVLERDLRVVEQALEWGEGGEEGWETAEEGEEEVEEVGEGHDSVEAGGKVGHGKVELERRQPGVEEEGGGIAA